LVANYPEEGLSLLGYGCASYDYPFHDRVVRVTPRGRICTAHRKINLSEIFTGQIVGVREVTDNIWLVSFLDYDPGCFDEEAGRYEPAPNPFVPEV